MAGRPKQRTDGRRIASQWEKATPDQFPGDPLVKIIDPKHPLMIPEATAFQLRLELVAYSKACGFGSYAALARALAVELTDPGEPPKQARDAEKTLRSWRVVGAGLPSPRCLAALIRATRLPLSWWLTGAGPSVEGLDDLASVFPLLRGLAHTQARRNLARWLRQGRSARAETAARRRGMLVPNSVPNRPADRRLPAAPRSPKLSPELLAPEPAFGARLVPNFGGISEKLAYRTSEKVEQGKAEARRKTAT